MSSSRNQYKDMIRTTVLAGRKARKLIDASTWESMTVEQGRVLAVLRKVRDIGMYALDVLDQMENADE